jgi:hypothetical protein
MAAGGPNPMRRKPNSFPIQLPLPVWGLMAVVILSFAVIGWWDTVRAYPKRAAHREMDPVGGLALPAAEIVDRPRAAAQLAPIRQSAIIRFRFRTHRDRQLTETEFGQLLLERKSGRCVYHFWYEGADDNSRADGRPWNETAGADDALADRFRKTLKAAAGFDGMRFWAASYDHRRDNQYAWKIVVYDGENDLRKYAGLGDERSNTPTFYSRAPLHKLIAMIESDSLERNAIHKALAATSDFEHFGGGGFRQKPWSATRKNVLPASQWVFGVITDQSELGIARIDLYRQLLPGTGPPPWSPVRGSYSLICENADDLDRQSLDSLTDLSTYAGDLTEVIEARDSTRWRP